MGIRYSRVNAIHVNRTQTESRTVVNHFSWAARCSYCDVTSKISWLTMFWGRWVCWFFVKFNQLLKISLECTSYTNVMILISVIFRLQWYQIQSSLKSINHLFNVNYTVHIWMPVEWCLSLPHLALSIFKDAYTRIDQQYLLLERPRNFLMGFRHFFEWILQNYNRVVKCDVIKNQFLEFLNFFIIFQTT